MQKNVQQIKHQTVLNYFITTTVILKNNANKDCFSISHIKKPFCYIKKVFNYKF